MRWIQKQKKTKKTKRKKCVLNTRKKRASSDTYTPSNTNTLNGSGNDNVDERPRLRWEFRFISILSSFVWWCERTNERTNKRCFAHSMCATRFYIFASCVRICGISCLCRSVQQWMSIRTLRPNVYSSGWRWPLVSLCRTCNRVPALLCLNCMPSLWVYATAAWLLSVEILLQPLVCSVEFLLWPFVARRLRQLSR